MPTNNTTSKMGKAQRDSLKKVKRAASQYKKLKGNIPTPKKNEKRSNNKGPQVRALTDSEKKRLVKAGSPPNPIKSVVNLAKRAGKAHTELHKKSKGVREASKATKPWAMGSMK